MKWLNKKIKNKIIVYVIFYLMLQFLNLISPIIMMKIIDQYIPNKDIEKITFGIILFISIPIVSTFLKSVYNYYMLSYVQRLSNEVSVKVIENILFQEYEAYDKENSYELLDYSNKEATKYIYFYIEDLPRIIVNAILCITMIIYIFTVNSFLGFIQLIYLPLCFIPMKLLNKSISKDVDTVVTTSANINSIKGEILKGIEYIKTNRLESTKLTQLRNKYKVKEKIWGRLAVLDNLTGLWCNAFISVLFTGLTFGLGALFIVNDFSSMTVGELISVLNYIAILYGYYNMMLLYTITKQKNSIEYYHLLKFLELEGEKEKSEGKESFILSKKITIKNLHFKYSSNENKIVFNNLSMEIPIGKWTCIVGESGSGKSTLLDLLIKLYKVADGMIYFDDIDINFINSFDIRSKITKVNQDIYLFDGTIKENLLLSNPKVKDYELDEIIKFVCLDEYVSSLPLGLETNIGELGKLMSGGEKQRLSLASGILRGNKILLLDEITSALDSLTEEKLVENLKILLNKGYTIISISHKFDFLKYADLIYTIADGQVINIERK